MRERRQTRIYDRWAQLRFSVIGHLLADPPAKGALQSAIDELAGREWRHPVTFEPVRFGASTIQRWYYALRERQDPVAVLRRKPRQDVGRQASVTDPLRQALHAQYAAHPNWSAQLHWDNLAALAAGVRPAAGAVLFDDQAIPQGPGVGEAAAGDLAADRRRFGGRGQARRAGDPRLRGRAWGILVHWDCHVGSRKVLTPRGEWRTPVLFGVLDDRSRLACHLQWYLSETAENIAHGLSQAFLKRGLPRAAMSDNGAAMTATEIAEGLVRLGVLHETTLPYSPYMNGKLEHLWAVIEGRLMAMLEGVADLSLAMLNQATQAWVEPDYNRKLHSEIGQSAARSFPRRPLGDAALSRRRGAQARLHPDRATRPAQERRNHRHRGPPFRGAEPIPPSGPPRSPLCGLGSDPRPSDRRTPGHGAVPTVPSGQGPKRRRLAPIAGRADPGRGRAVAAAGQRHGAAARPSDRTPDGDRTATPLSRQGRRNQP